MNRRNGFILGLLLLILVIEIIIVAPKEVGVPPEDAGNQQKTATNDTGAQHTMQGVSSIGSHGDTKEWELNAARAIRMTENEDWIIESVKVKFFGGDGVVYTVTGKQ